MNPFAENPFFFFVDNVPPISSVNPPKNARRIVELSDIGCDARLSVSTILRNATRYYSSKSAKMRSNGNWRPRCEPTFENVPHGERFRGRSEQNAVDPEELYFVPKEAETGQDYWQEYPCYEEVDDEAEYERKSEIKDFRINSRITPERIRHWRQENAARYEHSVPQYALNVPRNVPPVPTPFLKSKITTNRSFSYSRPNSGGYNREPFYDRGRRRTIDQDYTKNVENLKNHRDHWQREYNENLVDEISHQNHNFPRQNVRTPSSAKSSDDSKYWKEATTGKIRPGVRSLSTDRRKRMQPVSKTVYENAESQYDIQAFQDSGSMTNNVEDSLTRSSSAGKFKWSVDRAVDKDSLSDILDESVSKERLSSTATDSQIVNDEGGKGRTSFWEFISLEDDDEQKTDKVSAKRKPAWPLKQRAPMGSNPNLKTKRLTRNAAVDSNTKKKINQSDIEDHESRTTLNSVDAVRQNSAEPKNIKNVSNVSHTKLNTESVGVEASKFQDTSEALENLKNLDKNRNVTEKGPNRLTKFGFNADRKKQSVDNGAMDVIGDDNVAMSSMEKTATCTKRKFEKSKIGEPSNCLNQCSATATEKKIRSEGSTYSRLPVRIGRRLRSKNPIATRLRNNAKGCIFSGEESKDTTGLHEEANGQQNSVRSRTKPKTKSSVVQQEVILNSVEVAEYSKSMGNVQQIRENNCYLDGNEKGDENLIESNVDNKLIGDMDGKLGSNIDSRMIDSSDIANTTEDQWKSEIGSARGRELNKRNNLSKEIEISGNGLKENCFFNLHHEENIVCNSYCGKDCRKVNCFPSRKSATIKSRL